MQKNSELNKVRLPDGRNLSYAQYGDAGGPPVVLLHGWPGSRLLGRLVEQAAIRSRVRLIVPDRPGIGHSDPLPGRTLLDWARDMESLADLLRLDRFAMAGYSGGAPFALACASRFADRLNGVAIVSEVGPLDTPEGLSALPPHLKVIFPLMRRVPILARWPAAMLALGVRSVPEFMALQMRLAADLSDREILSRRSVIAGIREEYAEAFRQGADSVGWETHLFSRSWGFPLEGLPAGIRLYHGDADRFMPVGVAQRTAGMLPSPVLRIIPGAGHFWIVDHFHEVLDELVRPSARLPRKPGPSRKSREPQKQSRSIRPGK